MSPVYGPPGGSGSGTTSGIIWGPLYGATATALTWVNVNPTVPSGVICLESDTGKIKIGNGTSDWNTLAYWEPWTP